MSGFLYFKPGASAVTIAAIKEWGLGYAFGERVTAGKCIANSPPGGAGITFGDPTRLDERGPKMDMPNQTWGKIPKSDVWVGLWNDAPPTPEDLARVKQLHGYYVPLSGGRRWLIPLVRKFDQMKLDFTSALPTYMTLDEDGKWVEGRVIESHSHLFELLSPFAEDLRRTYTEPLAGEEPYQPRDFAAEEIGNAATQLISANYVVDRAELGIMDAFVSGDDTKLAISFACDFGTLLKWAADQKKTESLPMSDGLTSKDGVAA